MFESESKGFAESTSIKELWDPDGVTAPLSWGVCDVGPYWFRIECGRSLFAQLFQDAGTTTLIYGADDNSKTEALLTPDGQCRYGVTSALASFGEDCHTASKKLKSRLKQLYSDGGFNIRDFQPNGDITCRCVSREEMLVANIERFPIRHGMFGLAVFLVVVLPVLFCACCVATQDDGLIVFATLCTCFTVSLFMAMALIWAPAQSELQRATFRAATSYETQFWQGCGTTLNPMPKLQLRTPQSPSGTVSAVAPFGTDCNGQPKVSKKDVPCTCNDEKKKNRCNKRVGCIWGNFINDSKDRSVESCWPVSVAVDLSNDLSGYLDDDDEKEGKLSS